MLEIYGFQKTTLLDYPGYLACTVFSAAAISAVLTATTVIWCFRPAVCR